MKVPKLRTGSGARSALTAAMCMVAPTSMAAAFGCITGIVCSTLAFDLLRFISCPPADISGRAGLRHSSDSLNGIAGWRHHSQVRNSPWTMFFNGVTCHQNHIGRSLPKRSLAPTRFYPTGGAQRRA